MDDLHRRLLDACREGALETAQRLVENGADACWYDAQGWNALMAASQTGQLGVAKWLLSLGVPWNAVDKEGRCAGDFAVAAGHDDVVDVLVDAGCRAELLLGVIEQQQDAAQESFLEEALVIDDACIKDAKGDAVMMQWEAPLMEAHAEALGVPDGDVLNVGFGMGLIDAAIQRRCPKSHTIIEAHPQIHDHMVAAGWTRRPDVTVVNSRWQDVVAALPSFDAIFFDTYGEHYRDLQNFHRHLPSLLKPGGVYSFFNGLAPDNAFFHRVYCEIVKAELATLGMTTHFVALPIRRDAEWRGIRRRYWWSDVYNLPVAIMDKTV